MDHHADLRQNTAPLLLTVIAVCALLLSSCRPDDGGGPASERQKALSFLEPCRVETESSAGALYDLTALTEQEEKTLCSYGMYDETHILLLSASKRPGFGPEREGPEYTADLLDLTDGTLQELVSFQCAGALGGFSDGTQFLEIVSTKPLIVYDSLNGMVYSPETTPSSLVLPEWLSGASVHCLNGTLYLSSERGFIYDTSPDGRLHTVWRLPHTFRTMTPVLPCRGGALTFSTLPLTGGGEAVFADVDPVSGECRYYQSDSTPDSFFSESEGLLLGSSFRKDPLLCVFDPASRTQKQLSFPADIRQRLSDGSAGSSFVSLQTVPCSLKSGWCCWSLSNSSGRPDNLYLWDTVSATSSGWRPPEETAWAGLPAEDYGSVTSRACELEDRYGVKIVLGRNVPTLFSDYRTEPESDPDLMDGTLSVLENVLSRYPEQYFDKLRGNYYREIVFYLAGDLLPLDETANISNAGAFATDCDGLCQIALGLWSDPDAATVIHELTHAADYRFSGEGLWDDEAWNALNPPGFSYYNSYFNEYGESYEFAGSRDFTAQSGLPADDVYFIDAYSKTFGMEDRARLMENLMVSGSPYEDCYKGQHVQEKLEYYFRFLRDTLSDDTWPAATEWEKALENASDLSQSLAD